MELNKIYQGDCLELMQSIDDKSIDLVVIDPPYNIKKVEWDNIKNYVGWMGKVFKECERVLKDNGSFYFFHNDFLQIVELQNWLNRNNKFVFKQFIVWNKKFEGARNEDFLQGFNEVEGLRNYQKMAEYCLFYTFQDGTGLVKIYGNDNCFFPIKKYLREEKSKAGLKTCKQINQLLGVVDSGGGMASHYFSYKANHKQWALPTKEMYQKLQSTGFFNREYESLRQEYESLRQEYESLRYTFNNQKKHHSVWDYEIAEKIGHCTPKPVDLIENIILHSSNENDLILDCFIGSGTTAIACMQTNRNFIGMELEPKYVDIANKRIADFKQQLVLV